MRAHGTWLGCLTALWCCACAAAPAPAPSRETAPPRAEARALRYRLEHGCPLTYAFSLTEKSDQAYAQHREYEGRFVLRLGGGQVERGEAVQLVLEELKSRIYYGGRRMAPDDRAQPTVITLSLDGGAWHNERDPLYPWERLGSALGLGVLFPALPAEAASDAKAGWAVPAEPEHWQGQVGVVDVREDRTDDGPLRAVSLEARWRVAHVDSTGADTLSSMQLSGTQVDADTMERLLQQYALTKGDARGRYILSASGRLLRASIEDTREVTWHYDSGDRASKTVTTLDAALVAACDGPTLPPPEGRADTDEEAAIARAGELVAALAEEDADRALSLLDPSVIARHGGAAVTLLQSTATTHAPSMLGDPRYNVQYVRRERGDVVLRLQGSGRPPGQPNAWQSFDSTWTIAFRGGAPVIRSILVERHGTPVLEVSPERLYASP